MGCAESSEDGTSLAITRIRQDDSDDERMKMTMSDSEKTAVIAVPPIIESDESSPGVCCGPPTVILTLATLMAKLDKLLSNGADYKEPCVFNAVQRLMESYDPMQCLQWKQHCYADDDAGATYSRNLICTGSGYNLMLLVWANKSESVIHDHGGSECWLRVLEGCLTENFYSCPEPGKPLQKVHTLAHKSPGVCFINDDRGLHSIFNTSESERAVSLHCYVPGYDKCNAYLDEDCGDTRVECAMTKDSYCSIGGVRITKKSSSKCRNACSKVKKCSKSK